MPTSLIEVQYCYDYLINQIPVGLLVYSHVPTAILALLFAGYILVKDRRCRASRYPACAGPSPSVRPGSEFVFAFLAPTKLMLTWSLLDLFG